MPEQIRPIRCHHFRATDEPCMEPATHEVLGPAPIMYCEEHARQRLAENMPEGWEDYGAEEYARMCEEAVSFLSTGIRDRRSNPVLCQAVEEATTYLEDYELVRARERLMAEGEESAQRFGWTEEPEWVPRIREWEREAAKQ